MPKRTSPITILAVVVSALAGFASVNRGDTSRDGDWLDRLLAQNDYSSIDLFSSKSGYLFVTSKINDTDATLILDTGAPNCAVTNAFAERLGQPRKEIYDGLTSAHASSFVVGPINVGNINLDRVDLSAINNALSRNQEKSDGLLGYSDFLKKHLAIIDYKRPKLHLVAGVVSDKSNTSWLEPELTAKGFLPVELHKWGRRLFVRVAINDKKANLILDTGAPQTHITNAFAERIGSQWQDIEGSEGKVTIAANFEVGGLKVGELMLLRSDVVERERFDGQLGADVLCAPIVAAVGW